jgi:anti-sigma factor RsiW
MTCDSAGKLIPLYPYGELSPAEEDVLEQHFHECAACAKEMDHQRSLSRALDRRRVEVPPFLVDECRADLMAAVAGGAPRAAASKGPWTLFLEAIGATFAPLGRFQQPAGALALIAIGFFAARFSGFSNVQTAGFGPDAFATVRSVQPDQSGGVQVSYDETRRRVVSGRINDPDIQRLVLAAAQEDNPALRVESVELLKSQAAGAEIREVFLNALMHDANTGVRLKALEGLKPLAGDPAVRKTLAQALMVDANSAVRIKVVDLLMAHRDDTVVGVMQGLVQREDDNAVRRKLETALKEMNASVGTF